MSTDKQKVVLAYSGGLDTSILIPWLRREKGYEVHCLAGDVGQGPEELDGLEQKALASGAASCRVVDLREEFLTECVWPALRALAVYEGRYLLGTALARPVLARAQVAYAREVGAVALAHGCTGKGNDQVRFELCYQAFAPELTVEAPWREWDLKSREDAILYAEREGIPVTATRTKIYSRDRNLWHISHEGGALEDPACPPPDDVWMLTTDPRLAPDEPLRVRLGFEAGTPVSIDGRAL
ncbi:MAG: argininosuccinate synthase, partial [Planctomycetota bacterium]